MNKWWDNRLNKVKKNELNLESNPFSHIYGNVLITCSSDECREMKKLRILSIKKLVWVCG